jgi:hypothetical protein
MVAPLIELTKEEQRSVIRILWLECVKTSEIYRITRIQDGGNCMSEGKDGDWVETFTQGKAGECC